MASKLDTNRFGSEVGLNLLFLLGVFGLLFLVVPLGYLIVQGALQPTSFSVFSDPYYWHVFEFTYVQGLLSAVLSGMVGCLGAVLYSELRFPGRRFLWNASLVCFSLPTILVALAFSSTWGRAGWVSDVFSLFGISWTQMSRGWFPILAAHTFFNFPLFLRGVGGALVELDRTEERAALSLGASRWYCFFTLTLRKIAPELRSAFFLAFLYCSSSFLVVLLLGGGPKFTTLEVAIYQAVKIDFNLGIAARLAVFQLAAAFLIYAITVRNPKVSRRWSSQFFSLYCFHKSKLNHLALVIFSLLIVVLVGFPLATLLVDGAASLALPWDLWWEVSLTSLQLACLTCLISVGMGVLLAYLYHHLSGKKQRCVEYLANLPLAVSTLVLTLGWILLFPELRWEWRGRLLPVAVVQSMVVLPLVYRLIRDGFSRIPPELLRSAASLGASRRIRFLRIELPLLRRSLCLGGLMAVAFSFGDVGAVILFLTEDLMTWPLWIFRLMAKYEFDAAAGAGLYLTLWMVLILGLMGRLEEKERHA